MKKCSARTATGHPPPFHWCMCCFCAVSPWRQHSNISDLNIISRRTRDTHSFVDGTPPCTRLVLPIRVLLSSLRALQWCTKQLSFQTGEAHLYEQLVTLLRKEPKRCQTNSRALFFFFFHLKKICPATSRLISLWTKDVTLFVDLCAWEAWEVLLSLDGSVLLERLSVNLIVGLVSWPSPYPVLL